MLDLFDEPLSIPISLKERIFTLNDDFFDIYEDGLAVGIVNSRGTKEIMFHVYSSETNIERKNEYKGFVRGYFVEHP